MVEKLIQTALNVDLKWNWNNSSFFTAAKEFMPNVTKYHWYWWTRYEIHKKMKEDVIDTI